MGSPTLLVPGNLQETPGGPPQAELDRFVPIEFITQWLKRRMPEFGARPIDAAAGWGPVDRILVVQARTGAGKSTVMPAYVLRLLRGQDSGAAAVARGVRAAQYQGPGVLCTQPRVLTARTIAEGHDADDKHYPDLVLGLSVGYMTGPTNLPPVGGLAYSTIGVLTAQLRQAAASREEAAAFFGRYRFLILDEVHERSIDLDLAMAHIKALFAAHAGDARLPFVILTSATFDTAAVAEYYGVPPTNIVTVTGSTHPVETVYAPVGTNDYPLAAAEQALALHRANSADDPARADMLIFMPGAAEMKRVAEVLAAAPEAEADSKAADSKATNSKAAGDKAAGSKAAGDKAAGSKTADSQAADSEAAGSKVARKFRVYSVNREVVQEAGAAFRALTEGAPPRTGKTLPPRRIILSTNVAETGLTIPTLGYVIDSGWNRQSEYYPAHDLHVLATKPTPRSRAAQRRGRTGRLHPGKYYPLYTANVAGALPAQQFPDIVTNDLGSALLDLVRLQATAASLRTDPAKQLNPAARAAAAEFRAGYSDVLTRPPAEVLWGAVERAYVLGFISEAAPVGPGAVAVGPGVADLATLAVATVAPPAAAAKAAYAAIDAGARRAAQAGSEARLLTPAAAEHMLRGWGLTPLGELARRCAGQSFAQLEALRLVLAAPAWGVALHDAVTIAALFEIEPMHLVARRYVEGAKRVRDYRLPLQALRRVMPGFVLVKGAPPIKSVFDGVEPIKGGGGAPCPAASPFPFRLAVDDAAPGAGIEGGADLPRRGLDVEDDMLFRIRLALGDDFIEHLMLFNAFREHVLHTHGDPTAARKWAAGVGVQYDGLILWIEHRERILEALIGAGIDVFRPTIARAAEELARAMPHQWLPRVGRLKLLLYDALRMRVLKYDERSDAYRNRAGVDVRPPPMFTDVELERLTHSPEWGASGAPPPKPRLLAADRVTLTLPMGSKHILYRAEARRVSMLDGFVPHDAAFVGGDSA